ncbi:MAG: LURP-one-related family protein [Lachnospiraceae bacterium]|nr:LURP-one-related family protein [Lachnospiraceae bacterium]
MKLLFRQRFFSWFDSYDIWYEDGSLAYTVEGQLSWGHKLHILDASGRHVGTVKERVISFLPKFQMFYMGEFIGEIRKQWTVLRPRFMVDMNGWTVRGDLLNWDYQVFAPGGYEVAVISKRLFRLTDTYEIDVVNPADALFVLMLALAIDAEKCTRGVN